MAVQLMIGFEIFKKQRIELSLLSACPWKDLTHQDLFVKARATFWIKRVHSLSLSSVWAMRSRTIAAL